MAHDDAVVMSASDRAVLARVLETNSLRYPEQRVVLASRAENSGTTFQRLTAIAARCVEPGWNGYPLLQASRA